MLSRLIAFWRRCARERLAAVGRLDLLAELALLVVEVDAVEQVQDGVGAHAALEVLLVAERHLAPERLVLDDLAGVQRLELVEGALGDVEVLLAARADRLDVLLARALARAGVGVARALVLELEQLGLERLQPALLVTPGLGVDLGELVAQRALELGEVGVAPLLVDVGDEVGREVDDLLQLLGLQLLLGLGAHEQVREPRARPAQVPDVHDGRGELDVAHALAADLRARDLDAAALADDALEPDALVLAAVALPVLGRPEDLLAEQAVLLGAQRAVVDRLGLLHLAVATTPGCRRRWRGRSAAR